MFPLDFPIRVLRRASKSARLLDPFCGRGTALYAARLLGIESVGIDSNPVAAAIAKSKQAEVDLYSTEALAVKLLTNTNEPTDVPSGRFWELCYHPATLKDICSLREQLMAMPDQPSVVMLRAISLGTLHGPRTKNVPSYMSNQMPRTYATKPAAAVRFWESHQMTPPYVRVLDVLLKRIRYVLQEAPPGVAGRVIQNDSRTAVSNLAETFSHVVTSPPYYGMRTYAADQWLRNWFLGGPSSVQYQLGGQVGHTSPESFASELALVWHSAANRCERNARMIIRFGALPSLKVQAAELLRLSLNGTGWKITTIRNAGVPPARARQASQFIQTGAYETEIDLYARLE